MLVELRQQKGGKPHKLLKRCLSNRRLNGPRNAYG